MIAFTPGMCLKCPQKDQIEIALSSSNNQTSHQFNLVARGLKGIYLHLCSMWSQCVPDHLGLADWITKCAQHPLHCSHRQELKIQSDCYGALNTSYTLPVQGKQAESTNPAYSMQRLRKRRTGLCYLCRECSSHTTQAEWP